MRSVLFRVTSFGRLLLPLLVGFGFGVFAVDCALRPEVRFSILLVFWSVAFESESESEYTSLQGNLSWAWRGEPVNM